LRIAEGEDQGEKKPSRRNGSKPFKPECGRLSRRGKKRGKKGVSRGPWKNPTKNHKKPGPSSKKKRNLKGETGVAPKTEKKKIGTPSANRDVKVRGNRTSQGFSITGKKKNGPEPRGHKKIKGKWRNEGQAMEKEWGGPQVFKREKNSRYEKSKGGGRHRGPQPARQGQRLHSGRPLHKGKKGKKPR